MFLSVKWRALKGIRVARTTPSLPRFFDPFIGSSVAPYYYVRRQPEIGYGHHRLVILRAAN